MHERERAFRRPGRDTADRDETATHSRHSSTLRAPDQPTASGLLSDESAGAASSGGQPLPADLARRFASSLGVDLGGVRVHTGSASAHAAAGFGARAYAVGNDIHFASGEYDPASPTGQHLLAHEVAHTVQQRGAPTLQHKLAISGSEDHAEHEADRAADAMIAGTRFALTAQTGRMVARKPDATPASLKDLVARTGGNPAAAAGLLRGYPALRSQLLAVIRDEYGAAVVQAVLRELRGGSKDEAAEATIAAVDARCTTASSDIAAKTSASRAAIDAALASANAPGLRAAAEGAAAAIDQGELATFAGREELDALDDDARRTDEWSKADQACKDLDKAVITRASAILNGLWLPNESRDGWSGSEGSFASDIRVRGELLAHRIEGVGKLVTATLDAGKLHGKPRLDAAQQVRAILVTVPTAQRAYAISIIKKRGGAQDIVDFLEGRAEALRKEGGGIEVGDGGNSKPEADKQNAYVPSPAPLGKPGDKKNVKLDPSTGELGGSTDWKLGPGAASGGATVDVRADDGSFRFEGAKFEAGYTMKGQPTVKVNGGYTQTTTPPTFDGKNWIVSWTVTASAGAGRSKDHFEHSNGAKLSGDFKASGSLVKGGSKVFPDPASAEAYYRNGAFELIQISTSLPDPTQAQQMKEGETATLGIAGDFSAGGSASHLGVSVGAMASMGGGQDVKLTKTANNKLVVTFRDTTRLGANASMGTLGLSGGMGGGTAEAVSTTAEFDLGTEAGKAAYAKWAASLGGAPTAGPGVRILSTGKGDFLSRNVGIGGGISPLNASATTTATTGSFTETTADGKHKQETVIGSNTDAVKGIDPITPDRKTRTDAIEITTTDNKTADAAYTMRTTVQGQADAKWANAELGKVLGEPSTAGQALDGKKSSGTTGKWTIEGSYSKKQIDEFLHKVASGGIVLKQKDGAAELKETLQNPKLSDHDKQVALAKWYALRGSDAAADMRTAIGPPSMNVTLDGDKYLAGKASFAVFEGKRVALEDRFLAPDLQGDKVKDLLRDVQALYVEQLERRDHIANPTNYPELPSRLRHELVKQAAGEYEKVRLLRFRVAARAKETGVGDPDSNTRLNQQMGEMARARANATDLRSRSVDRRAKHDGALSAGIDSPRKELTGLGGVGNAKIRELYAKADFAWQEGIRHMNYAEEKERTAYKEHCLDASSQATAVKWAGAAVDGYHNALKRFAECISSLDVVQDQAMKYPTPTTPKTMWNGYGSMYYGPLD